MRIYVCIYIYMYIYICIYVCMYILMYNVCVYIYIYIMSGFSFGARGGILSLLSLFIYSKDIIDLFVDIFAMIIHIQPDVGHLSLTHSLSPYHQEAIIISIIIMILLSLRPYHSLTHSLRPYHQEATHCRHTTSAGYCYIFYLYSYLHCYHYC